MTSHKPRTTSKSGGLAKSTKTEASSLKKNSSQSATASFVKVFGKSENPETARSRQQLDRCLATLAEESAKPLPTNSLLRTRQIQKLARLKRYSEALRTLIEEIEEGKVTPA